MNKDLLKLVELGVMPWEDLKAMIVAYNTAMAKCHGEIEDIAKNEKGRFTYASYEYIRSKTKETLAANGISIEMLPISKENGRALYVRISHKDGYFDERITPIIESDYNPTKMCPEQKFGSSITYAKRYAYCTLLAIATYDKDIDGFK